MIKRTVLTASLALTLSFETQAATGDIYVEIMAEPMQPQWLRPGHAFACVVYHLNSGIKEECYGFYRDPKEEDLIVGAPALSNEFKRDPRRFARISWSLKKKVSHGQLRRFFELISQVNTGSYKLFSSNCGDFVSDAVNALGWKNAPKGPLPEPYVRDLYTVNITKFTHPRGSFTRSGQGWTEKSPHGTFVFSQDRVDSANITIRDSSRSTYVRLPLRGGLSQIRQGSGGWSNLYSVQPQFD